LTNKTTQLCEGNVQKYEYAVRTSNFGIIIHYLAGGLGHDWPSTQPNDDNPDGTYYDATPIYHGFL
jgi:hypothetical protein